MLRLVLITLLLVAAGCEAFGGLEVCVQLPRGVAPTQMVFTSTAAAK